MVRKITVSEMSIYKERNETEIAREIAFRWDDHGNCVRQVVRFLNDEYSAGEAETEHMYFIGLDKDHRLSHVFHRTDGNKGEVFFNYEEMILFLVFSGCKYFLMAHNHPNGICFPSDGDLSTIDVTDRICKMFDRIMYEDLVLTPGRYYEVIEDEERIL